MYNRREFLGKSLKASAGWLAVSVLPLGLAGCSSGEAGEVDTETMANLGSLSELETGEFPKVVPYQVTIQDAWTEQKREGVVYVNKDEETGSLLIMSPVCTHLGCMTGETEADLKEDNVYFYCPCHGGQYNEFGVNIGGPPPRPLDIFRIFLHDGNVYISVLNPRERKG